MSAIHQIYCTHCTHGSSALERREGELARRTLGYSARAGSMDPAQLRRCYRQIERYVYYYLPRDTPAEEKLRLNAATAPRRLVYLPSAGGVQLVAQVCYRQTDSEGRPGSYFAHVLFQEETAAAVRWSPVEAVRLWSAPGWVSEDSPQIPFVLPSLESLGQLVGSGRPAVDDAVLWSFLSTPADGAFDDPSHVIPARWRQMPSEQRRHWFGMALGGLVDLDSAQHESLTVVMEPSVAALFFYGLVRLLPAGVRAVISLSTFEPNPERAALTLAATTFHDPARSDLKPEAYRGRGFAMNTFLGRHSQLRRSRGRYAHMMLERLLGEGWQGVQRTLDDLALAGADRPEDLDSLADVERLVPVLFDAHRALPADSWRHSAKAFAYLRRCVGRRLAQRDAPALRLASVVGRPAHLALLELLLSGPELPDTRAAADYLLRTLPMERTGEFVGLAGVGPEPKVELLARYVQAFAQLPPGCDALWNEPLSAPQSLLPQVLARLDLPTLKQFHRNVAEQHSHAFVAALVSAHREHRIPRTALGQVVSAMSDDALVSLARRQGPGLLEGYPREESTLGVRLRSMLLAMVEHLEQFCARLDLILAGAHLLPRDEDRAIASAWGECREAILEIGRLQDDRRGLLRTRPIDQLEAACQRAADAIARALPRDSVEDDRAGTIKRNCLRQIGRQLLGGKELLPSGSWRHQALWQKIAWRFEHGNWPTIPLERLRPKSQHAPWRWVGLGVAAGILLLLAAASLWTWPPTAPAPSRGKAKAVARAKPLVSKAKEADKETRTKPKPKEAEPLPLEKVQQPDVPEKALPQKEEAEAAPAPVEKMEEAPAERSPEAANPNLQARPLPEQEPGQETWESWADRFARQHAGTFLERVPLQNLEAEIPAEVLGQSDSPLFVGAGRIFGDDEVYEFGAGFDQAAPTTQHPLAELANKLGLASVRVELRQAPGTAAIVVVAEEARAAPRTSAQAVAEKKSLLERARMMSARVQRYESTAVSEESRKKAYDELLKLMRDKIPPEPKMPELGPNATDQQQKAHAEALKKYKEEQRARDRLLENLVSIAKEEIKELYRKIEQIDDERRQAAVSARKGSDTATDELRRSCQRISVIVYRDVKPAEQQPAAPEEKEPAANAVPAVAGTIRVETRSAVLARPPAIAVVKAVVVGDSSRTLPQEYRNNVLAGCLIMVQHQDGFVRAIEVQDIEAAKSHDVFAGTAAVHVQFRFFRRPDDPFHPTYVLLAHSAWQVIQPVEKNREYTVRFELGKEGLGMLEKLWRRE